MIRAGVVGATGYVGSELLRWIHQHPRLVLSRVVSRSRSGQAVSEVLPGLAGIVDGTFEPFDPETLSKLDVVFLATPHGAATDLAAQLHDCPCVVDCSRDHRHVDGWSYGQPEWVDLRGSSRIAAPGCFATSVELALAPLVQHSLLTGPAMVTATTGSTGSGATASTGTHHPTRAINLRAYKVLRHQHVPEIRSFLDHLGSAPAVHFVPLSGPFDRGIFASVLAPVSGNAVSAVREAYEEAPMIRIRDGSPELRWVRATAFADIAVHQEGDVASVLVAIDNLGKGAAAQAVQAFNAAAGWPQELGLRTAAATP